MTKKSFRSKSGNFEIEDDYFQYVLDWSAVEENKITRYHYNEIQKVNFIGKENSSLYWFLRYLILVILDGTSDPLSTYNKLQIVFLRSMKLKPIMHGLDMDKKEIFEMIKLINNKIKAFRNTNPRIQ